MKVEEKLGRTRFKVREESHIKVRKEIDDMALAQKLCMACPAGLYSIDAGGKLQFSHLGCLECGTCRLLGYNKQLEAWDYPVCDYGVQYYKS